MEGKISAKKATFHRHVLRVPGQEGREREENGGGSGEGKKKEWCMRRERGKDGK